MAPCQSARRSSPTTSASFAFSPSTARFASVPNDDDELRLEAWPLRGASNSLEAGAPRSGLRSPRRLTSGSTCAMPGRTEREKAIIIDADAPR